MCAEPKYSTEGCKPDLETPLTNVIIEATIKRFIKHRIFQYGHGIMPATTAQIHAIEKIRNHLAFLKGKPTKAFCHMVVFYEQEIMVLLPGENTRFPHQRHNILNLIIKSKELLNK